MANIDQMPRPNIELDVFKNQVRNKVISASVLASCGCRIVRAAVGDALEVDISAKSWNYAESVFWNWMTLRRVR
jgi:hypothetical protein